MKDKHYGADGRWGSFKKISEGLYVTNISKFPLQNESRLVEKKCNNENIVKDKH